MPLFAIALPLLPPPKAPVAERESAVPPPPESRVSRISLVPVSTDARLVRLLERLSEEALDHAMHGEIDLARRAIAQASPLFGEVVEANVVIARAALFLGEACVLAGVPRIAMARLREALAVFEPLGDVRAISRADDALERARLLLALESRVK